jgi:hypothetical protein
VIVKQKFINGALITTSLLTGASSSSMCPFLKKERTSLRMGSSLRMGARVGGGMGARGEIQAYADYEVKDKRENFDF